jgi:hypothetical protein
MKYEKVSPFGLIPFARRIVRSELGAAILIGASAGIAMWALMEAM